MCFGYNDDEDRDFSEENDVDFDDCDDCDDGEELIDGVGFADPGGRSALRAETASNPRIYSCPTCGRKNVLTLIDVQRGYQCDHCADAAEGGF